jgi:hypothetical protein
MSAAQTAASDGAEAVAEAVVVAVVTTASCPHCRRAKSVRAPHYASTNHPKPQTLNPTSYIRNPTP